MDIDIPVHPIPAPFVPVAKPMANTATTETTISTTQLNALLAQGFTPSLAQAVFESTITFPLCIWIIDNSGSMAANDGKRLASKGNHEVKSIACTRWKEIQETVDYHAQLAALLESPTVFRLLNDPGPQIGSQIFSIADKGESFIPNDLEVARNTMKRASPSGVTPLVGHIYAIREQIQALTPSLQSTGKKVVVIIATDGLPTDETGRVGDNKARFVTALKSLEGLPVWIVIRLCTDIDSIVEFYNSIDSQLEMSIEVLDNYTDEATEMYARNPWLTYSLPIHRMREMGFHHRLFDFLDERQLTLDELYEFCGLLFGKGSMEGVPEPALDFEGFIAAISILAQGESKQFNPIKEKMKPVIDVKKLRQRYGDKSCAIM